MDFISAATAGGAGGAGGVSGVGQGTGRPLSDRAELASSPWDSFVVNVLANPHVFLSCLFLAVGVFALAMQIRAMRTVSAHPNDYLRACSLTLIITFSLSLAALLGAGQLEKATPIFGLFSTIAGYLLGSTQRSLSPETISKTGRTQPATSGPEPGP
jgi:hypothetical protein